MKTTNRVRMMPATLTVAALAVAFLMGCVSAEDKNNAKRKAELDLEQAELIVEDCTATSKALNAWYDQNRAEADALDTWWTSKSSEEKDKLMEAHKDLRNKTHKKTLGATLRCGFVAMNSRRSPG